MKNRASRRESNSTDIKIAPVLPTNTRMRSLSYLNRAESNIDSQSPDAVEQIPNARYGETDSARARASLASFAEFKRRDAENYKDFRARFARWATLLEAHGANLSESIIFHRSTQSMRIPGGQRPILLGALEAFSNPASITALRELSVKMYELRRGGPTRPKYSANITRMETRKIRYARGRSGPSRDRGRRSIFDESENPVK